MNDGVKNGALIAFTLLYVLFVYLVGFSSSYSHRNTFVGRLTKKFLSIFNILGFSFIPPLVYLILYVWSTYVYYDIVNRVLSQLTNYEDIISKIALVSVPVSMIFFIITILIPPKHESDDDLYLHSYLVASPITKHNSVAYTIFLLSTAFTFTFHLVFVMKYLVWRLWHTVGARLWETTPPLRLLKYGALILLRDEPELTQCALRGIPICVFLYVSIIDQIYLMLTKKPKAKKEY